MRIGFLSYDFYPPKGGQGVEAYNLYGRLGADPRLDLRAVSSCSNQLDGHTRLAAKDSSRAAALHFSLRANQGLKGLVSSLGLDALQVYGGPGGVMLLRDPAIPVLYVANHTYRQQLKYLGKKVYHALARMERTGYRMARHIVAISSTTMESLVEDYGIPESRITVIPVGVDTSVFKPLEVERLENSMLFVGRLCERKGIPHMLEACSLVREEVPGFKLFIAGEGELRVELQDRVDELGLGANVDFLGKVGEEELPRWYNRVSLFCLPSRFEGFGIVCLEAMACGTPVVASRAPGIIDVIPEEHDDLLIEPGDVHALAAKIISLLQDDEGRGAIGRSLRSAAEDSFDWSTVSARFIDVYERELDV
ncbi:MAG: glycosyltransferase family 4 protein [Actinobacteria bacterium]|nr:glycosyltransferase family 4 protein [Actinomycetota bacterium]